MFWETLPGAIASWGAAITVTLVLFAKLWNVLGIGSNLFTIGSKKQWPNGAKSLPEALDEIYRRQGETHDLLQSYIVAHRADHGLDPP